MFRTLIISKKHRGTSGSRILIVLSFGLHCALLGYFVFNDYLTIPGVLPPAVTSSLSATATIFVPTIPSQPARRMMNNPRDSGHSKKIIPVKPPKFEGITYSKQIPEFIVDEPMALDNNDFWSSLDLGNGDPSAIMGNDTFFPTGEGGESGSGFDIYDVEMTKPYRLSGPDPQYPKHLRDFGYPCTVKLEAKIDVDGWVVDIVVLESCGTFEDDFNNAAITAVKKWRFAPATLNGSPVPIRYQLTIQFEIQSGKSV